MTQTETAGTIAGTDFEHQLQIMSAEIKTLAHDVKNGNLQARVDMSKFVGEFRHVMTGVNDIIAAFAEPVQDVGSTLNRIAAGDSNAKITTEYKGDYDLLKQAANNLGNQISIVVQEMAELARAADAGNMDYRGDPGRVKGDIAEIINGANRTMESVAVPLKDIGDVLDQLAAGNTRAQVTNNYKGAYNILKQAANNLGNQISIVVQEMAELAKAANAGNMDYRGDPGRVKGDIAEIINGANRTMEGVAVPLKDIGDVLDQLATGNTKAQVTNDYKGAYNIIKQAANNLGNQLRTLILDDGGQVLSAAAAKDLTARVSQAYQGDFNLMKDNINMVLDNLDQALAQVGESVEQVTAASTQISSGSQSLAQGANEQASSLEQISASLEEIASMTKQNADNSRQAKAMSDETKASVENGQQAMARMSEAIEKIKASSDETAKIIKTIDEIAFQTNLLALNAAVEAARAGEAGKGFAVVAEEVRNLAQRSAEAAKNTASLIEDSVKNSEGGVRINEEVTKILEEIVDGNVKLNGLIAEISAASEEQSKGVDQVNIGVSELNKVTQQNAANSEESASAAEELNSQAEELAGMVGEFRLSTSSRNSRIATRPSTILKSPQTISAPRIAAMRQQQHSINVHSRIGSNGGNGNTGKLAAPMIPEQVLPLTEDDMVDF